MIDPCQPVHYSAATLHRWAIWRRAHRSWRWAGRIAGPCSKAAIVGLPLAFGPPAALWPAPGYLVPGPGFAASGPGVTPLPPTPAAWLEGWGPYGGGEGPGPFGSPSPTAYSPAPPVAENGPPQPGPGEQPGPSPTECCGTVGTPPPPFAAAQPPTGQPVAEPASLLLLAVGAGAAALAARGRA